MSFAQLPNAPYGIPCTTRYCRRTGRKETRTTDSHTLFHFAHPLRYSSRQISPAIRITRGGRKNSRLYRTFVLNILFYIYTVCLASSGSDLLLSTLGTLLAHVSLGLALGGGGSVLGLLSLLGGLGSSLLLLVGLDGLSASGRSGLGAHGAALLDDLEGGTNDGTLGLDGAAGALLGNFLQRGSVMLSDV
jgi:hypothetical protein